MAPGDTPRIGPNAITRIAEALVAGHGRAVAGAVFAAAGLSAYLEHPPTSMVPEADVAALHAALSRHLAPEPAIAVAEAAGRATARYLLAHRIPRPAQMLFRVLPASLAAKALTAAIRRHAWTFCGSADFRARAGRNTTIIIAGGLLGGGAAAGALAARYYMAVFECLYAALVTPGIRAVPAGPEEPSAVLSFTLAPAP